jgi:hypothetical protein
LFAEVLMSVGRLTSCSSSWPTIDVGMGQHGKRSERGKRTKKAPLGAFGWWTTVTQPRPVHAMQAGRVLHAVGPSAREGKVPCAGAVVVVGTQGRLEQRAAAAGQGRDILSIVCKVH